MARRCNSWILMLAVCALLLRPPPACARTNALAIFNLIPTSIDAMGYNGDILYALISTLEKEKTIELMPRREMEEILFHAGIVQGDDPAMILKAGKVLDISFILFGQVSKTGQQIQARLKLMDIRRGAVIQTWTPVYAGRDAILKEAPALAEELSASILGGAQRALAVQPAAPAPRVAIRRFGAEIRDGKAILTWEVEANCPTAGFNLYRAASADGPFQFYRRVAENSFTDADIRSGRSYFYRLGTLLDSGEEVKGDPVARVLNVGAKIPHAPLILEGRGFVRRATLKFVPSLQNEQEDFAIVQYRVWRRPRGDEKWEHILTVPADLSSRSELAFNVEDSRGLEDGRTYEYALSSVDREARESPLSDLVSLATTARPALELVQDRLLRRVILSWQAVPSVAGYYLYRSSAGDPWVKVGRIADPAADRTEDTAELADGRPYRYYLSAYDPKGETGPSNEIEAATKDLPRPPAGLTAESGLVKSVRLSWTPLEDADVGGYLVYRGRSADRLDQIEKLKNRAAGSYTDTGGTFSSLEDGTLYRYAVSSFNLFDAEGKPAPAVAARTKPRPAPVRGLAIAAGPQQIVVTWEPNAEPDIGAYILQRSRNEGFWSKIAVLEPDRTRFADGDLKPESEYRYKVVAEDKDGLQSDAVESASIRSPVASPAK